MTQTATLTVEPEQAIWAKCALGHQWAATLRVQRDRFQTKREGHRPSYQFHYIYTPDRCPTCGHRPCQSKPR